MRVALLSRNVRAGDAIGQQVLAKLSNFQQRGAEVRLFLSEHTNESEAVVGNCKSIWNDEQQRQYLLSADLVIAEFGAAYDLLYLLPALQGRGPRLVVEYHGLTPIELADAGLHSQLFEAQQQRSILWAADAILVHSQFARQELVQATGIPVERIHQLPCWVAPVEKHEAATAEALRQKHGLVHSKVLLFVGRFARNKQPRVVIEALAALRSESEEIHAIFVGPQDDLYREHLTECQLLAQQLNVMDRVHFLGRVSERELAGWYQAADVLVFPSKHECFGMPAVEVMQRGKPVLIGSDGALPEVVQQAGIQCDDWAKSIQRILAQPASVTTRRIALVTHRFGSHFAGGAEKSLRVMAQALQSVGYEVEVFTTCNTHESQWVNTLPAGTVQEDGFTVHRFPIDPFDAEQLGQAYQTIREQSGTVTDDLEQQYLRHSLGSKDLLAALEQRQSEWEAIITGPYLFKLIFEVAQQFGDKVLLAPCFHDEPLAKLRCFRQEYREVAGLLFHTEAEARYTAEHLGISNPRHIIVGTVLSEVAREPSPQPASEPYLVYCGRYCPEKGLDRLLQYMDAINAERAKPIRLVCIGQGPMKLPRKPWLVDKGFVSEHAKRDTIAGALALVHLSRNESLSIVALEAWAQSVPVIVDEECVVLVDQVNRSQAGVSISSAMTLAQVVDRWITHPEERKTLGSKGRRFVEAHYASAQQFAERLQSIVNSMHHPLTTVARQPALQRAKAFRTVVWEAKLAQVMDQVQLLEPAATDTACTIEVLQSKLSLPTGTDSTSLTIQLQNTGSQLIAERGPAAGYLLLSSPHSKQRIKLTQPLVPGQSIWQTLALDLPGKVGTYSYQLRFICQRQTLARSRFSIELGSTSQTTVASHPLSQSVRQSLTAAKKLEKLPDDYVDVTEGLLSGVKHSLKRKLLNNFRKAYVDVAFRQQSTLNEKLIAAMSLLAEGVLKQDTAATIVQLEHRLRKLEKLVKKERRRRLILEKQLAESPGNSLIEGNVT